MNIPTDVLRTCTKTNKHDSLCPAVSPHWGLLSSLWTVSFSGLYHDRTAAATALFLSISHLRQHNLYCMFDPTLRHFFGRARVCLETHKLLGHLVVGPLRKYPHDGEACFIHGDALHQGVAGGAAALVRQLSELDDCHADDAVLTGKAVVLYWDVQLIGLWTMFIAQNTGEDDKNEKVKPGRSKTCRM